MKTTEIKIRINKAKELGVLAFNENRSRIPAQDVNVMALIKGLTISESKIATKIFAAWQEGYTTELLKAARKW